MSALTLVRQLWRHSAWADVELFQAFSVAQPVAAAAWREYTHILGAQEIWLSRLEQRQQRIGVWPTVSLQVADVLRRSLAEGYTALLAGMSEEDLERQTSYTTTDGRPFTSSAGDILVHVALHGQYHRGKVNLLLRQEQCVPAPVDFIAFVRGAPTATTPPS
jgi:uncharacterized damage-inducible protein DinB